MLAGQETWPEAVSLLVPVPCQIPLPSGRVTHPLDVSDDLPLILDGASHSYTTAGGPVTCSNSKSPISDNISGRSDILRRDSDSQIAVLSLATAEIGLRVALQLGAVIGATVHYRTSPGHDDRQRSAVS
jgi:hypothetical protein